MSDEYMPLRTGKDEAGDDEAFGSTLNETEKRSNSSLSFWLTIVFSVFSIASALALHANVASNAPLNLQDPKSLATLKKLAPYPNLNQTNKIKGTKSMPKLWFPGQMIRANAAQPDEVYSKSNHVTLSPTDSMFYSWSIKNEKKDRCYIWAVVPGQETLEAGGKGFKFTGDVTEIEVWNVTTTPGALEPLSWNTRPERQNLLGTVNFTSQADPKAGEDNLGWDGAELRWPTPRFPCHGKTKITLEIACKNCTLEFDQIFSDPALGFDLQELA